MVGKLWSKEMQKEGLGRNELVKVLNGLEMVFDPLNMSMVPLL